MGFLASFFINSPIGRWVGGNVKTIIVGLMVVLAIVCAVLYVRNLQAKISDLGTTIATQQGTIGQQKQQLADAKAVNDDLNRQLKLKHDSETVTDNSEKQIAETKTDNAVKYNVITVKHDVYVKTVQADTTIAPDTKVKLIASADITQIWQGYCMMPGVNHPTCAQYMAAPVSPPLVDPAPAVLPTGPKHLPTVTAAAQADPPAAHAHIVPIALELAEA